MPCNYFRLQKQTGMNFHLRPRSVKAARMIKKGKRLRSEPFYNK